MAYEKQTWQTGDVVTAAKLNNMENGIADALQFMLVTISEIDEDNTLMDKTWQEIFDALSAGKLVLSVYTTSSEGNASAVMSAITSASYDGTLYSATYVPEFIGEEGMQYTTSEPDGYPKHTDLG